VWTGLGTVGATLCGMWLFGESRALPQVLCILLIVTGVLGLKLTSGAA
jgi:quaternary ammonium compound-resistance protein SugE